VIASSRFASVSGFAVCIVHTGTRYRTVLLPYRYFSSHADSFTYYSFVCYLLLLFISSPYFSSHLREIPQSSPLSSRHSFCSQSSPVMLVSPFQFVLGIFTPELTHYLQLEYSVEKPLNREPPLRDLVQSFITKTTTAYDRNHG